MSEGIYMLLYTSQTSTHEQPRYELCVQKKFASAEQAISYFNEKFENDGTSFVVKIVAQTKSKLEEKI